MAFKQDKKKGIIMERNIKKIYLDLDDTLLDTESYIRFILDLRGIKIAKDLKYDIYTSIDKRVRDLLKIIFASDYDAVPWKIGAKECFKLLETEFEIVFVSSCTTKEEEVSKKKFADKLGKKIILCSGDKWDKSHVDMSDGIFIEDNLDVLMGTNAAVKIQMYNPYNFHSSKCNPICPERDLLVTDWFQIIDYLMEVDISENFRRRFCEGIQNFCVSGV